MSDPYRLEPCGCPPFWVATRTFTLDCPAGKVGSVSVTRQYRSNHSLSHAEGMALKLAEAEARAKLVCSDPELNPFDFAVLRYIWTEEAGRDLDTRTAIVSPARALDVGWSRLPADPMEGQVLGACAPNSMLVDGEDYYLAHGGDNCEAGVEAVLINFVKLVADYPVTTPLDVRLRAFWYSTRATGNVTLQFETYLGGEMVHNGYDFENSGGTAVQTLEAMVNVIPVGNSDQDGADLAILRYLPATKTATLLVA